MRKPYLKLNHRGSTLLTVVICLALVSILGAMMLSVTMTNLQMKLVESKSKMNFYSCETAMEEIRTGIEELTASKIREVYETDILKNFAVYLNQKEETVRNNEVKKKVALKIIRELGKTDQISDETLLMNEEVLPKESSIFDSFLSDTGKAKSTVSNILIYGKENDMSMIESIVIKDICVTYTNNDYETTITSNLVITIPDFAFQQASQKEQYRLEAPFKDYALIADGEIVSDSNSFDPAVNTVIGSVYGGKGIKVDGRNTENLTLAIQGGNIVTRGDITAADTGKLTISGITQEDGEVKLPLIWADNLVTETTSSYIQSSGKATTLEIDGISLIKDDLALEGRNSKAKIAGAYVGYSGEHTSKGSAMMINGSASSLDLKDLDSLILAGRAHISLDGALMEEDIMTGESIALKINQLAYLIPGRYIEGTGHNPITPDDIPDGMLPKVDLSGTNIPLGPADPQYSSYIDIEQPYKIAAKQTLEGNNATVLRYFYLDFESGKQADAYLQDYLYRNRQALTSSGSFSLGTVTLPEQEEGIACVGNLISYDGLELGIRYGLSNSYPKDEPDAENKDIELDSTISRRKLDDPVYTDAGLKNEYSVGMLNNIYSNMTHLLSRDGGRYYQESDEVVASTVISGAVEYMLSQRFNYPEITYYDGDKELNAIDITSDEAFIVVKGDAVIHTDVKGIIIAGGDITISSGVTVDGLVISAGNRDENDVLTSGGNIEIKDHVAVNGRLFAAGNINLGLNDIFTAAEDPVLLNLFRKYGELLRNVFKNPIVTIDFTETEPLASLVDISAMITYENWRRN